MEHYYVEDSSSVGKLLASCLIIKYECANISLKYKSGYIPVYTLKLKLKLMTGIVRWGFDEKLNIVLERFDHTVYGRIACIFHV